MSEFTSFPIPNQATSGLDSTQQATIRGHFGAAASATTFTAGTGLTGGGTLASNRTFAVNFGTSAGTVCQGNDSRLSNARTPTTHASTHATGQADAISPSDIGAAPNTVIDDYLGPVTLTSAASIAWNIANGNQANLEDLAHDATVTLSGLADGQSFTLAGTMDGTGGRSLTIAHSGLTVRGAPDLTTLGADDGFMISGRRKGTDIFLTYQSYTI